MPGSRIENQRHFHVLLIAASCALSALAILRDPIINDDGVFYLMLAREAVEQGFGAAFALFERPLYPVLIAVVHQLSGLSLLASAHLLDAALLALLVLNFTRFVATLCGDPQLAPWAALLVLMFPQLNEYRSFVLADFGFWALLVSALLPLLRYQASQRWRDGLAWALLVAAAAAFRPEAFVYLALLPLGCLQGETLALRLMSAARLYACLGVLVLPPALVLARFDMLQLPLDTLVAEFEIFARSIVEGFGTAAERYATTVLDHRVAALAGASLAAGLLAIVALKFLAALGLVYCVLLGWGLCSGRAGVPAVARGSYRVLLGTALLIVATFVLARQFVSGRHLLMLCLLALVPAALILRALAEHAQRERRRGAWHLALGLAIVLLGVDGFVSFGTRNDHRHQGIAWMRANLPAGARVFSNDRILAWYSGGRFEWQEVTQGDALIGAGQAPLRGVDYWVLQREAGDAALARALAAYAPALTPLARFGRAGQERIEVFAVASGAAAP